MLFKALLVVVLAIPACAVAYYFAVALPAHNKTVLEFEQQKYAAAQEEKRAAKAEAARRTLELRSCLAEADNQYYRDVKNNGEKAADGTYSVDTRVQSGLEHKKQNAITECQKKFGD
ncbi:MAG: hypothetical protein ABSE56_12795 [Bryobacteraceae bacterium]|jgi:hypothetical protein